MALCKEQAYNYDVVKAVILDRVGLWQNNTDFVTLGTLMEYGA